MIRLLLVIVLFSVQLAYAKKSNKAQEAIFVTYTSVELLPVQESIVALGSVYAKKQVDLVSQVSGVIQKLYFTAGQHMKKGDVAIKLDDTAKLIKLKQLTLQLDNQMRILKENQQLVNRNALSSSKLKAQLAVVEEKKILVQQQKEILSNFFIKAPFSGVVGLNRLVVGQYVKQGEMLGLLTQINQLYVDLRFPSKYLTAVSKGLKLQLHFDAVPNASFDGKVMAISPVVDVNTRNFTVRVSVSNEGELLRPGILAKATLFLAPKKRITIPTNSIFFRGSQAFVYLVENKKAIERVITIQKTGDQTSEVKSGLNLGDFVIVSGLDKMRNGVLVSAKKSL